MQVLYCDHGLQWSIQRFAYFGRNFLIGYSRVLVQTVQLLYCDHGLQWSIQRFAYFGKNFLIGYSIVRREKPFADEEQSCYI